MFHGFILTVSKVVAREPSLLSSVVSAEYLLHSTRCIQEAKIPTMNSMKALLVLTEYISKGMGVLDSL